MILTLSITGLKGGPRRHDLSKVTLVDGPNGAGKSSILDAIRFLFGLQTAGVGAEGGNLRALMEGDEITVEAKVLAGGVVKTIRRSRRVVDGTFKSSTFAVDGIKDAPNPFGSVAIHAGRDLLDLSDEKLNAFLSRIGADASPGVISALIDEVVKAGSKGVHSKPDAATLERIGLDVASELASARAAAKATASAVDASRRELGPVRVEVGLSSKLNEELTRAMELELLISTNLGSIQGQMSAARQRAGEMAQKLSAKSDAGRAGLLQEEATRLQDSVAAEASAHGELVAKAKAAHRAIGPASDTAGRLHEKLTEAESRAASINPAAAPPCSRSSSWISPEDPFAEPEDLCGVCPLAKEQALWQERRAKAQKEASELKESVRRADEVYQAALAAYENANASVAASRQRLDRMQDNLHEVTGSLRSQQEINAAALSRSNELREEAVALKARLEELDADQNRLSRELAEVRQVKDRLTAEVRTARINEERLRRQKADEASASAAEAHLTKMKALEKSVSDARSAIANAGADRIIKLVGPVHGCLTLAYEGGRFGLTDGRSFWTNAGLSAAQRELLSVWLDYAVQAIDKHSLRLMMIEADPLDVPSREGLMADMVDVVAQGYQVIICSWMPFVGLTGSDVAHIHLGSHQPAQPAIVEADPFDDPFDPFSETPTEKRPDAIKVASTMDGPGLTQVLNKLKASRPGAFDKVPRSLENRRELLIRILSEIPESEHEEIMQP
jgi:archaellum component FlaC